MLFSFGSGWEEVFQHFGGCLFNQRHRRRSKLLNNFIEQHTDSFIFEVTHEYSVPSPKQQSPKSVSDSEFVTRAEYNRLQARIDELHAEMIQRIAALEAKLAKQGTI